MEISAQEKISALESVLTSAEVEQSPKLAQLLRFLAAQAEGEAPKETVIGVAVFGREPGYDPKIDPVVRVEVRRLRAKLLEHYAGSGSNAGIRLEIPKGGYGVRYIRDIAAPGVSSAAPPPRTVNRYLIALGVVSALVVTFLAARTGSETEREESAAPKQVTTTQFHSRSPAWSPDGKRLAFSRDGVGVNSHILVLEPGQQPWQVTSGMVRDYEPVWAPNGALGFLRATTDGYLLMQKDRLDQPEREITRLRIRQPFSYSPDSRAVYVSDREQADAPARLWRVEIEGGKRMPLTGPGPSTLGDLSPKVSPDGRRIAFLRATEEAVRDIWILDLGHGTERRLSADRRAVEGMDWSADGTSIIASTDRENQARSLWQLQVESGQTRRIAAAGLETVQPAVDRVHNRLAYVVRLADTNIWRIDLAGNPNARPLTSSIHLDTSAQISPDGEKIAFRSTRSGSNEIWVMSATGGEPRQLSRFDGPLSGSPRWSPDGSRLVLESRQFGNGDLFVIPAAGGSHTAITNEPSNEVLPSWSRDGRFIYFSTDRTGQWEIFRKDVTGGGTVRVTQHGGFAAFESPDGRFVYYTKRSEPGGVWRKPVMEDGEEELLAPLQENFWGQWAIGRRSLFYLQVSAEGQRQIVRMDLATRQRKVLHDCKQLPVQFDSSMSVAMDESFLTWSQLDSSSADIFVLEMGKKQSR